MLLVDLPNELVPGFFYKPSYTECMKIVFHPVRQALQQLTEALTLKDPSDLERDGTIQRFEYCYEILWKSAQKILRENEVPAETPKAVFRELGRLGWIENVEAWLAFQKARNETKHEYGVKHAENAYRLAKIFLPLGIQLLAVLEEKSRE